jgi:hypothetical protein
LHHSLVGNDGCRMCVYDGPHKRVPGSRVAKEYQHGRGFARASATAANALAVAAGGDDGAGTIIRGLAFRIRLVELQSIAPKVSRDVDCIGLNGESLVWRQLVYDPVALAVVSDSSGRCHRRGSAGVSIRCRQRNSRDNHATDNAACQPEHAKSARRGVGASVCLVVGWLRGCPSPQRFCSCWCYILQS